MVVEHEKAELAESGRVANPYAPPTEVLKAGSGRQRAEIRTLVSRPATALVVMSSINAVFLSITIVAHLVDAARGGTGSGGGESFVLLVARFGLFVVISIGAAKLGHLESYRFGRVAAVCACIPGLSPFVVLGIPFGIWALRLLADPEIRSAFPDGAR